MDRPKVIGVLAPAAMGLLLGACEAKLFLGFGLPDNEACSTAAAIPSKPVPADCIDSLGH